MLSVAFRYRETNWWKELTDSDVFAVRLSTGEIGYCCVMGNAGEHNALSIYIGDSGFSTYLKTIGMGDLDVMAAHEVIVTFNCINCDFANASGIMSHNKEIIKAYAESHGLKIRRSNGWPDFVRYSPYKMPWGITSEQDAQAITEALSASLDVSKMMKTHSFGELGFDVKVPTIKGAVTVECSQVGTIFSMEVKIPGNTEAEVILPVRKDENRVSVNGKQVKVRLKEGKLFLPVLRSGNYQIVLN